MRASVLFGLIVSLVASSVFAGGKVDSSKEKGSTNSLYYAKDGTLDVEHCLLNVKLLTECINDNKGEKKNACSEGKAFLDKIVKQQREQRKVFVKAFKKAAQDELKKLQSDTTDKDKNQERIKVVNEGLQQVDELAKD